jgi:SecD/SecF fusion protein
MLKTTRAALLMLSTLILVSCASNDSSNPKFQSGYRLVYEVQWDTETPSDASKTELVEAIRDRLETLGFPSSVQLLDDSRLEIKIPTSKKEALAVVRQAIPRRGRLELRVVAVPWYHEFIIDAARKEDNEVGNRVYKSDAPEPRDSDSAIGKWVRIGRVTKPVEGTLPLRIYGAQLSIRDAKTKKWITLDHSLRYQDPAKTDRWLREQGHEDIELLVATDDGYDIQNEHIKEVRKSIDRGGNPSIAFEMTELGAKYMESFTHEHLPNGLPNGNTVHRLAIIVDDEVISAPNIQSTISTRGEITGKFTLGETVELACLLGARPLPARLSPKPIEEHAFEED